MKIKIIKKIFIILIVFLCSPLYANEIMDELEKYFWISTEYMQALAEKRRDYLVIKYPDFEWFYKYYNVLDEKDYRWYENSSCIEGLQLSNGWSPNGKPWIKRYSGKNGVNENSRIITYRTEKNVMAFFIYNDFSISDNKIYIHQVYEDLDRAVIIPKKTWPYDPDKEDEIIVILDGDYLQLYYCGNYVHTFCKLNGQTLQELKRFIKTETCDFTKITWPRHADGSCDYDGSKKAISSQTSKSTTSTNVALNKTMTVKENLKLRSGEATSTQVLTVMSAGTKVKIT
jgi:hypothetical protein